MKTYTFFLLLFFSIDMHGGAPSISKKVSAPTMLVSPVPNPVSTPQATSANFYPVQQFANMTQALQAIADQQVILNKHMIEFATALNLLNNRMANVTLQFAVVNQMLGFMRKSLDSGAASVQDLEQTMQEFTHLVDGIQHNATQIVDQALVTYRPERLLGLLPLPAFEVAVALTCGVVLVMSIYHFLRWYVPKGSRVRSAPAKEIDAIAILADQRIKQLEHSSVAADGELQQMQRLRALSNFMLRREICVAGNHLLRDQSKYEALFQEQGIDSNIVKEYFEALHQVTTRCQASREV